MEIRGSVEDLKVLYYIERFYRIVEGTTFEPKALKKKCQFLVAVRVLSIAY